MHRPVRIRSVTSSLVIQTSFLGDTVLTTPLIAELSRRGPVDVLVTPGAAPLLANNPSIRTVLVYDKRGRDRGPTGLARIVRRVRAATRGASSDEPGVAYLAQGSLRSALIARLAGFRERVGFDTSPARSLYTRRVAYERSRHHAERLWRLAFPDRPDARPPTGALVPRLYPGTADVAAVDALLAATASAPTPRPSHVAPSEAEHEDRPLVVLAPGSVWGTKRWPFYPELAARLAPHAKIAVVGSPADTPLARAIGRAAPPGAVVDATGALSLLASAELIRRAAVLVTNDSLPQHLASAVGTPTVTLFGPTVPELGFGPLAPRSVALGHPTLPCRPCHHHGPPRCPLGHWRCMRKLAVDAVEAAVRGVLDPAAAPDEVRAPDRALRFPAGPTPPSDDPPPGSGHA